MHLRSIRKGWYVAQVYPGDKPRCVQVHKPFMRLVITHARRHMPISEVHRWVRRVDMSLPTVRRKRAKARS